jgi:hypothetical protein
MTPNQRVVLFTTLIMVGMIGLFFVTLWASTVLALGPQDSEAITRVRLAITLLAAVQAFVLVCALVALGVARQLTHVKGPAVYPPVVAGSIVLCLLLSYISVNALDLLIHDLNPTWTVGREPEVLLLNSLLLLGLAGTKNWFASQLVAASGWQIATVFRLYFWVSVALVIALVVIIAVLMTR